MKHANLTTIGLACICSAGLTSDHPSQGLESTFPVVTQSQVTVTIYLGAHCESLDVTRTIRPVQHLGYFF